jgi:tetratricopeptide (TPR) repeat protein
MSVDDLRGQLEMAYAAIRELDDDLAAGRVSASDHASLKERAERRAAALLKRVREAERRPAAAPARPEIARAARRGVTLNPLVVSIGAVGLVVLGVSVGVLLARSTSETPAPAAVAAAPAAAPAPARRVSLSPALEALRNEVEADSAPTAKLLAFARLALEEGQIPASIWADKRVLARDPRNVEAITRLGVILYQANHLDQALARVDQAVRIDPKYAYAQAARADILLAKGDHAGAAQALEKFLALIPPGQEADRAREMLERARTQARSAAGAPPARR